jgi:hypothetical protein
MHTPHTHTLYIAALGAALGASLFMACGGDVEEITADEYVPPAKLDVSPRSLTIDSDARSAAFTIANTGGEALMVDIESDDFHVDTSSATLPGGTDVVVKVTVVGERADGTVILAWTALGFGAGASHVNQGLGSSADGLDVTPVPRELVTVGVSVKPLRTESRSETVVDTQAKIAAGRFTAWTVDAPAGARLTVELSSTDTVDTWLMTDADYDAFQRGDAFLVMPGSEFVNVRRAGYTTGRLPEGRYELVVSNQRAWLLSRTVTVKADMTWETTIPARE